MIEKKKNAYKLIPSQINILKDQLSHLSEPRYNVGIGIGLQNRKINYKLFCDIVESIISEYDALRIRIYKESHKAIQEFRNEENITYNIDFIDLSNEIDANTKALDYMKLRYRVIINPFDNNLFEFCLIKVSDVYNYIFLKFHHIIVDGRSCILICDQILKNCIEIPTESNKQTYKFSEYIQQWNFYENSLVFHQDQDYWRKKFSSYIPQPVLAGFDLEYAVSMEKNVSISKDKSKMIYEFCAKKNCTLSHFFLAVISLSLGDLFRIESLAIGISVLNRRNSKEKKTVGLFDNILAIKLDNISLSNEGLLEQISSELVESYRHSMYPFSLLEKWYKEKFGVSASLFSVVVSYIKIENHENKLFDVIKLSHRHEFMPLGITIRDMENDDIQIDFDYRKEIFNGKYSIDNFVNQLLITIENYIKYE